LRHASARSTRSFASNRTRSKSNLPIGHHLRFNVAGELIGVSILNGRWLLHNEGKIVLTLPERIEVEPEALTDVFAAASS
jgi:hypothetical protein